MSEAPENPYRPQPPVEPPEEPDFQDLDDKPWLRTETREPLIGYWGQFAFYCVIGICAVFVAGCVFGRRGMRIAAVIAIVLLGKGLRR